MSKPAKVAELVRGYVVVGKDGRFLCRKYRWRSYGPTTHYGHPVKPAEQAYVHTGEALSRGGAWVASVSHALEAIFSPLVDTTIILSDKQLTLKELLVSLEDPHLMGT